MSERKNLVYKLWNGKNVPGKVAGADLISEGPRNSKTSAKYDVSNDTIAAEDLQKDPQ